MLAFCHIEKAAGTSLIHVLRKAFFLRYLDVRPLYPESGHVFRARDFEATRRIYPFVRAIGGHSVVPRGDLLDVPAQLDFITQVRDPIERVTSQYRYRGDRLGIEQDLRAFLEHPASRNVQVRKIAGCEDVELAKSILSNRFLLAGTVDRFDEFLVMLARKLDKPLALFTYGEKKNVARGGGSLELPPDILYALRERNRLDQELYDWMRGELHARYLREYGDGFADDLRRFRDLRARHAGAGPRPFLDYAFRKAYFYPATGLVRLARGLPYRGSYATN